jgi:pectinesterase
VVILATLVTSAVLLALPTPRSDPGNRVVSVDGSREFKTIQAAIDSIPPENSERVIIDIKNGTYKERVRIRNSFITLRGQDRKRTRIVAEVDTSACKIDVGASKEEHCATVVP